MSIFFERAIFLSYDALFLKRCFKFSSDAIHALLEVLLHLWISLICSVEIESILVDVHVDQHI